MSEPGVEPISLPSRARVQPGDVIAGKYEVERVLAEGGMGIILAAHHRQLRRRVALKFLLPDLCHMQDVVARFLREAQAMTTIQNEHVARVLDVGTTPDAEPYMVMEYLEGEDLAQSLDRRERIPAVETVEYVLQAMEALAEAHVHGFVHRDLKPSNLFVTRRPDGSPLVKVLDFGISKVSPSDASRSNAELTHARGLLGSPLYMSPEQIRNSRSVDHRADIWTLGVIMHELVTGRPPFEGDSVPAVLAQIVADEPVLLLDADAQVPAGLSDVVRRCLQRDREDRYASVAELASALRPYATRDGLHSIEKIERVIAHNQRVASPVDLRISTPKSGLTPVGMVALPPDSVGLSPLAATAPASVPPPVSGRWRRDEDELTFGKYRLVGVLGQGGMSDVFLAVVDGPEGLGLSKLVVVKRLRSNLASDPEFVSMLVDEARIASKLNHPNVVRTYEVGVIANEYYIAMEFLEGQPLNRILLRAKPETIPLAIRLAIVREILVGLHHAHELTDYDGSALGVVHRDVTPQNAFVTYDGQVKVVDFGIAKARGRATVTGHGVVKGKVAYMSPEQAAAGDVDRRADVYSAGVVLWELLTGERMWKGIDDIGILQKLSLDQVPTSPRSVNPEVPSALDDIVQKALARKPSDRYATALELQNELETFMKSADLEAGSAQLADWLMQLFADRRHQTRSLIESQLNALRAAVAPVGLMELRESGAQPVSTTTSLRLARLDHDPVLDEEFGSLAGPVIVRSQPGPGISTTWATGGAARWAVIAAGFVVVAAAVTAAVVGTRKPPEAERPVYPPATIQVASASAAPSAPAAPAPTTVILDVSSPTPGMEVAIDDGPRMRVPVTTRVAKGGGAHRLVATAPGYRSDTRTVSFESDVALDVALTPALREPGRAPPPSPRSSAQGSLPVAAPPAGLTARPKRELDPDNPYSGH